jgi:hypothetical protein
MQIQDIFYYVSRVTICITFLLSAIILVKNNTFGYLRLFPFYHASSIITEIIALQFFALPSDEYYITSNVPYNVFTLLEFLFFSLYIFQRVNTGKSVIITSISLFLILYFLCIIKYTFDIPFYVLLLLQNLFLLIQCIVYFNDVFTTFSSSNLEKEPAFWIITGIMFYSIITSPMQIYRLTHGMNTELRMQLYITTNGTAYLLMYMLFIKGYTCKVAKSRYGLFKNRRSS